MEKPFNIWLPRKGKDGVWRVVMERPLLPPVVAVDWTDHKVGYVMDEDEAIEFARRLNSIAFHPDTPPTIVLPIEEFPGA
jgi:hypothetical protein